MAALTASKTSVATHKSPLIILETGSLEKALNVIIAMGYDPRHMRKGALKQGKNIIVFDSLLYDHHS